MIKNSRFRNAIPKVIRYVEITTSRPAIPYKAEASRALILYFYFSLPYLSSHKLRFTVASMLYNGGHGMNVNDLKAILEHSNVAMTLHYVEAYTGNEEEIRNRTAAEMEKILGNRNKKTS